MCAQVVLARSGQAPNHTPQLSLRQPHARSINHQTTWGHALNDAYSCTPMRAISYSTARAQLAGTMNKVCEDHEPVVITRRGEPSVVMLSPEDDKAMEETSYLLRSPANAQRLLRSIASLNSGGGEEHNDAMPWLATGLVASTTSIESFTPSTTASC